MGDPLVDGQVLAPEEAFAGEEAAGVFERRTGVAPSGAGLALSWPSLRRANADEPYDTELGLLADTLAEEGVRRAVVANADGSDTELVSYERQAAYALTDGDGVLEGGSVDGSILRRDPDRPFGVRLDEARSWLPSRRSGTGAGGASW